jgi:hypothetical protein
MNDPRCALLPPKGASAFYIHKMTNDESSFDFVSGPFLSLEDLRKIPGVSSTAVAELNIPEGRRVLRVHLSEIADDPEQLLEHQYFIPYESVDPKADPTILKHRTEVDAQLIPDQLAQVPAPLRQRATSEFAPIIEGLFHHALCSMTRIVISSRWEEFPDWVAVTVRDSEKRQKDCLSVAFLRETLDGRITAHSRLGQKASSSSLMTYSFHKQSPYGILLHSHLVFAVLLDKATEKIGVIQEVPRTKEFARALIKLFEQGYPWVLRRSEGIWCFESSPEKVLESALACQDYTLSLLV